MTRGEMLDRISSRELTGWFALYLVEAEEDESRRDLAESGDGVVVVHGKPDDEEDEDEDGGETE